MPDEKTADEKKIIPYQHSSDFRLRYANNVFYETTLFDIKTTFGELVQSPGKETFVEQHSAITMSWLEAKLAVIFLAINVATHEKKFGTVSIPEGVMPPVFKGEEAKLALTELLKLLDKRSPLAPEEPTRNETTQ